MPDRLFDPVVPPERLHPAFVQIAAGPGSELTRLMMEEVFASFEAADANFIEQFQTSGFSARVFELFLYAYFTSLGARVDRAAERPDYLVTQGGVTIAVEATTANPTQVPGNPTAPIVGFDPTAAEQDEDEVRKRIDHEIPIRVGSALFSKLKKRYWELPHVKGRPLVLAVEPFHAHDALLFSSSAVAQYLYGVRQTGWHDEAGQLTIDTQPIVAHRLGEKEIPSGFFALPGAEHVSAVLFTNAGTVSKFTRMGYQAGFHRGNVLVFRNGTAHDPDPNAADPATFAYRLDEQPGEEPWGSGVEIFHNPRALHPVPADYFGDAAQTFLKGGIPTPFVPPFLPFASMTIRTFLDFESLRPVEDRPDGVGTIMRREFDRYDFASRPAYATDDIPFSEVAWFADRMRTVLGTVLRWHGQERYGLVILQQDQGRSWRAVDTGDDYDSLDAAATEAVSRMQRLLGPK